MPRASTSSIHRLIAEPHRFGFFQAVRLLERWFEQQERLTPGQALSERLLFRNSLAMAFPASEIAAFHVALADSAGPAGPVRNALRGFDSRDGGSRDVSSRDVDSRDASSRDVGSRGLDSRNLDSRAVRRVEITPSFIGLLGAGGTLPNFYTELFAQRELYHKDTAARAFLDVFLHRAVVLFYQSWRKHRLAVLYEADRRHRFAPLVLSLGGLGAKALRDRLRAHEGGVADDTLAFFTGVLRQRPVSAVTIRRVLAQYFRVPVALESFIGRWFMLPGDNQTALGMANASLGGGAVMGERVWQRDLRLRLTLGPMARDRYRRFLPGGPGALALRELLTLMTGVTLEYEVRLTLRAADVQPAHLSATDSPRLGWDGFLVTQSVARDRSDAGYDIHAVA